MALHPILRWIGLALAAFVVAVLALVVALHGGTGERWVADRIQQAVPGVVLDGFTITWPFTFTARTIDIADRDGIWLHVENPSISWHPSRLLRRIVAVEQLRAQEVVVRRLPAGEEDGGGQGGGLPRLAFRVDTLKVPITLEEPVLGEPVKLDLAGTFRLQPGGGAVDVHLQAARGGIVRLVGSAATDFLDLRWYLQVQQMALWQRLLGIEARGQLAGTGLLAGRLPSPLIDGTLDFTDFTLAGWGGKRLAVAFRAIPYGSDWQASLRAAAEQPHGPVPLPAQMRLDAVGDVDPAAGMMRLGSASLTAGVNRLRVNGILADWGKRSDLRASAVLDDLHGLVPSLKGAATASAVVNGDLTGPDLRARLRLTGKAPVTGIAILDGLMGAAPEARLLLAAKGRTVRLLAGQGDGARVSLNADGLVWPQADLHARAHLGDLAVLAPQLKGSGTARGRVRGAYDGLRTWGIADLDVEPVSGQASFDFSLAGAPEGYVGADLLFEERAVTASARIRTGDATRIEDLKVASRGAQVTGALSVVDGVTGRLRASVPSLSPWLPEAEGRVEADAVLDGHTIRLRADGRGLAAGGATAQAAQVAAVINGTAGTATLDAQRVEIGGLAVPSASAAGQVRLDGPRGAATLDRLVFALEGQRIALATPAQLHWEPDSTRLEPVTLETGGGTLRASGEVVRRQVAGTLVLDRLPLALAEAVIPRTDAVGEVSGRVTLGGTLDDPTAHAILTGTGIGFATAARAGLGRMVVSVDARLADNRVNGSVSARDGDRLRGTVTGGAGLAADAPVDARVELTGDMAQITEALPLAGHLFAGRLQADAAVGGTLDAPRVNGRATLSQGRYENLDLGTVLTGLEAELAVDGTNATLRANATDGHRGTASLTGRAGLTDGPQWQANLALSNFRALWRDDVHAAADAQLEASGIGAAGRVAGQAKVDRAEIDIAHLQRGGPVKLEVEEINQPGPRVEKPPPPRPAAASGPEDLALAIDVSIERAFVRGRGLDSEWQGRVAVGGTAASPSLDGRISPERGRYDFLGKTFQLSRDGGVVFEPGRGLIPRLEIIAEADAGDITARVEATGDATAPQVEITSDPPLPRDEVLSRVLFGTEPGKLSAFQQIQLGQMAAGSLTGGGDGFDPIGSVRGALGLDVLEVGSTENGKGREGNGSPTLSAGKYIGKNTFLRVEQGAEGLGSVILEREIGRGLSITTELGQQAGSGAGIEWRKNY